MSTTTFPPAVAALRERFETWRNAQTRKGPLPRELWQAAAALLPTYPTTLVARACRLNPSTLKHFAQRSTPPKRTKTTPVAQPAFRALTPDLLQQAAGLNPPASELRFVLERRDGTRLTVTCPASANALAEALSARFLTQTLHSSNKK